MKNEEPDSAIAEGRSRVYRWLSLFFLPRPNLEVLRSGLDPELLKTLQEALDDEAGEVIEWLAQFAQDLDESQAEVITQRYHELFDVPVPGKFIPPHESCFREGVLNGGISGYGNIWGKTTVRVLEFYKRSGLEPESSERPPDHIGIEFLFMSNLCQKEVRAIHNEHSVLIDDIRKEQLAFLNDHLFAWLPAFADRVLSKDEGFFGRMSQLATSFVKHDLEYLNSPTDNEIVAEPRP